MLAHTYFPPYFSESFLAKLEEGGCTSTEVEILISPPEEDRPVLISLTSRGLEAATSQAGQENVKKISIADICSIALKEDWTSLEINRKNGIPLTLTGLTETKSLVSLLCGYYRLGEKWTFSLCSEFVWPCVQEMLDSKVHSPVPLEWAERKLSSKAGMAKGSFMLFRSHTDHQKVYLLFCEHGGCKPKPVTILASEEIIPTYWLEQDNTCPNLPGVLQQSWPSVRELVAALRSVPSFIELTNCLHPSEYDRCPALLPCRTDSQWKEDRLRGNASLVREKVIIGPGSLSKFETSMKEGRMCTVWRGEWRRKGGVVETVAIKQLNRREMNTHSSRFLEMARRVLEWDDGSLAAGRGLCLPSDAQPPVLVTEWFSLGPLDTYLGENRMTMQGQPVDLLEAATCLAKALFYLEDQGLVHGEIRARNLMVDTHTDTQFKVKLCEGSLSGMENKEVHWLDFQQLQAVTSGRVPQPTHAGDVWSSATTLWELFSFGDKPLPYVDRGEAIDQYLRGLRLPKPSCCPPPVFRLMQECWQPNPLDRKRPQEIMRDMNQLLMKSLNTRIKTGPIYVPMDGEDVVSTHGLSTPINSGNSFSNGTSNFDTRETGLVPMFEEPSRKLLEAFDGAGRDPFGSTSPLLPEPFSRSGSSIGTGVSGTTYQTFVDWGSYTSGGGLYSISSIYQLDQSQIEYHKEQTLGEGNFGVVYKGVRIKSDGEWEEVAIKKMKDAEMNGSAVEDMQREVELMKSLSHDNIVKIKGVLDDGQSVVIVMEYVRFGSLDRYLQVNVHNVELKQLFGYSQNIVDGMEYLTHNKIIHRDLAARNILVADQETVKISDFGLAREAKENDFYVMSSATRIPIKWEAIECLTLRKYSSKSDVWSFGVTLWEMFAYGATPAMVGCENFFSPDSSSEQSRQDYKEWLSRLENGHRLPRTDHCPEYLYTVMLRCWRRDPAERPSFHELKRELRHAELIVT